jgi:hypothetical protein
VNTIGVGNPGTHRPVVPSHMRSRRCDHTVAAGNVALQLFEEGTPVLLEVLLLDDLGAGRLKIALERFAALTELLRDTGKKDLHRGHQ